MPKRKTKKKLPDSVESALPDSVESALPDSTPPPPSPKKARDQVHDFNAVLKRRSR